MRRALWLVVVLLAPCALALLTAPAAAAHPLGNFTVNHFNRLTLHPDRIDLYTVVDLAEIPTLQERAASDGTAYAEERCRQFAATATISVDGTSGQWRPTRRRLEFPTGEAGLRTTRLTCEFTTAATLRRPATVEFRDGYRIDRIGWHELVITGDGARPVGSPLPTTSISDELRAYPDDLLADPLDVRAATLRVEPGDPAESTLAVGRDSGWLDTGLTAATSWFTDLTGSRDLTPLVGVLAVLLSLVLGASHAALPGHGKTVIAAYLAGKHGSVRDAITVGATVTVTHTAGVLVLGVVISVSSTVAGESVLGWLGIVSGSLVALIGAVLLRSALRHRRQPTAHGHGHGHGHGPGHGCGGSGPIGMGIAGGLVPSPSALVVLLGAIALGRTWFGVLLVLGYGLGMAATLTLVGLLLVRLRDRFSFRGLRHRLARLHGLMPVLTASLVLLVGLGLAVRAATGIT